MKRKSAKTAFFAAAAIAASFALASCDDIINSLLDNGAPQGVSASDGEYADSIHVSWAAPNLSSEKWEGYEVRRYRVEWTGPSSDSITTTSTNYSINIQVPANRAQYYEVTVTTEFTNLQYGGSASDTGFAMDADTLIWVDGGSDYTVAVTEQWYVTMLQENFAYRFDFSGSETGAVEFYPFKSLELIHGTITDPAPTWTCDDDGKGNKFYVRVTASSVPTSFTAACDNGYGF